MLNFQGKVFKYRVPCSDQGRGTRGGFRLIAYYHEPNNILYPISLYPKSDQDDIEDLEVTRCINELAQAMVASRE